MGVIYFLFVCSNFFLLLASSQILGNQSFTSINHRFEIYRSVIRKLQTFLRCPSVQLTESMPHSLKKSRIWCARVFKYVKRYKICLYAWGSKNISYLENLRRKSMWWYNKTKMQNSKTFLPQYFVFRFIVFIKSVSTINRKASYTNACRDSHHDFQISMSLQVISPYKVTAK